MYKCMGEVVIELYKVVQLHKPC